VEQREVVDGRSRRCAVELVIEDRAHRAVGQGADLDGSGRCSFEASGAERPNQAECRDMRGSPAPDVADAPRSGRIEPR
jgi:hypothetical protein